MTGKAIFDQWPSYTLMAERLMRADELLLSEDDEIVKLGQDELDGVEKVILDRRDGIDASIRALERLRVRTSMLIVKLEGAQGRGPLADWCA